MTTWPVSAYRKKAADVLADVLKQHAQDYYISRANLYNCASNNNVEALAFTESSLPLQYFL